MSSKLLFFTVHLRTIHLLAPRLSLVCKVFMPPTLSESSSQLPKISWKNAPFFPAVILTSSLDMFASLLIASTVTISASVSCGKLVLRETDCGIPLVPLTTVVSGFLINSLFFRICPLVACVPAKTISKLPSPGTSAFLRTRLSAEAVSLKIG